jgi:hypothetical protein
VRLQELKFQMAVRDQIISEQRDVISNLWAILGASGLTRRQVMDIARAQGIVMQVSQCSRFPCRTFILAHYGGSVVVHLLERKPCFNAALAMPR